MFTVSQFSPYQEKQIIYLLTELLVFTLIYRNVIKLHRRDQEVCCTSLDMLMKLLSYVEEEDDSMCSQEKQDGRSILLYLVNAFW